MLMGSNPRNIPDYVQGISRMLNELKIAYNVFWTRDGYDIFDKVKLIIVGEELGDCRSRPKILADALEALIAAVYLDSVSRGTDEYKRIVLLLFSDDISRSSVQKTDFKTKLQQLAEQDGAALLEYRVIGEEGPEHDKSFTVAAYINNNEVGRGSGRTKKHAEMQAAKMALKLFGVIL